jgi:hypothetical protein
LPRINQRREVETDNIHLQFETVAVVNHGSNDSILDLAVMQVHANFVADVELSIAAPSNVFSEASRCQLGLLAPKLNDFRVDCSSFLAGAAATLGFFVADSLPVRVFFLMAGS